MECYFIWKVSFQSTSKISYTRKVLVLVYKNKILSRKDLSVAVRAAKTNNAMEGHK